MCEKELKQLRKIRKFFSRLNYLSTLFLPLLQCLYCQQDLLSLTSRSEPYTVLESSPPG